MYTEQDDPFINLSWDKLVVFNIKNLYLFVIITRKTSAFGNTRARCITLFFSILVLNHCKEAEFLKIVSNQLFETFYSNLSARRISIEMDRCRKNTILKRSPNECTESGINQKLSNVQIANALWPDMSYIEQRVTPECLWSS